MSIRKIRTRFPSVFPDHHLRIVFTTLCFSSHKLTTGESVVLSIHFDYERSHLSAPMKVQYFLCFVTHLQLSGNFGQFSR